MASIHRPDNFPAEEPQSPLNIPGMLDSSAPTQESIEQPEVPSADTSFESTTVFEDVQAPEAVSSAAAITPQKKSRLGLAIGGAVFATGLAASAAFALGSNDNEPRSEVAAENTAAEEETVVTEPEIHGENDMIVEGLPWYTREFIPRETMFGEPISEIVQDIHANIYRSVMAKGDELTQQYVGYSIGTSPDPAVYDEFMRFVMNEREIYYNSGPDETALWFYEENSMQLTVLGTEDVGDGVVRVNIKAVSPDFPDKETVAVWDIASAAGFDAPDSKYPPERPIIVGYPAVVSE